MTLPKHPKSIEQKKGRQKEKGNILFTYII
jgi:hypothetical protein